MPSRKRKQFIENAKLFVKTWQESNSTEEVAQKLDVGVGNVCMRARYLQKLGVPLKNFPAGKKKYDPPLLKELAKLAESLGGEGSQEES